MSTSPSSHHHHHHGPPAPLPTHYQAFAAPPTAAHGAAMLNAVWLNPTANPRPLAAIHDIDPLTAMFHLTILGLAAGAHYATDQPHARLRPVRDPPAIPLARVSFSLTQSIPSSPLKASSLHGPQHHNRLCSLGSISLALFLLPLVASIPSLVTPLASLPPHAHHPPPTLATTPPAVFATALHSFLASAILFPTLVPDQKAPGRLTIF